MNNIKNERKFYKVTYKTIRGFAVCYCETIRDILDISENPYYGEIDSVERIIIPKEGFYLYGGCE